MTIKIYFCLAILSLALLYGACRQPDSEQTNAGIETNFATQFNHQPLIEAAPVETESGDYKFVTGDSLKITVRAADAAEVGVFYQPVTAADRVIGLQNLNTPAENSADMFVAELKIPVDFNGEVWARVKYKNGATKETDRLLLARRETIKNASHNLTNQTDSDAKNPANKTVDTDESARADKATGGRVERAALKPGDGNIKITVNVPAFTMTLWQNGSEIGKYFVGVGRKAFPIPIGMRSADKIILNPDWIPPDSSWVRSAGLEPYSRIPASDPDNPLGKIKIPLGDAYLLHEAQSPKDLGNLVSHGCVRVLRDDLFAMTKMIAGARNLSISKQEFEAARKNSERRVIDLNGEIPVDINYDSMVIENGILTVYPDVYERGTNTVENLRQELATDGVDVSKIDEKTLSAIIDKVSPDKKFVVALADVKAGKVLDKGKTEPLTPQQAKDDAKKQKK